MARRVRRWGHAVLREGVAREPWQALARLLEALDALFRPLAPGASAGMFASMNSSDLTEAAKLFVKCVVKTIVCNSIEASNLGRSRRMLEVAAHYLDSEEIYFENGSLRLHLCGDRLEALDFHIDNAEQSAFRMLNYWVPMNRVLPGQEIRMVPFSHRIGPRGRRVFEALPTPVKRLLSTRITDYEPRDVHMWGGDTEHGRVPNPHAAPAVAMVFRYAGRPLSSDWRRVDEPVAAEPAIAASEVTRELEEVMRTLIPEVVERMRSTPSFWPAEALRLLHSEQLVAHPSIGRQLALCLIYYYQRAGLDTGPGEWPAYLSEILPAALSSGASTGTQRSDRYGAVHGCRQVRARA